MQDSGNLGATFSGGKLATTSGVKKGPGQKPRYNKTYDIIVIFAPSASRSAPGAMALTRMPRSMMVLAPAKPSARAHNLSNAKLPAKESDQQGSLLTCHSDDCSLCHAVVLQILSTIIDHLILSLIFETLICGLKTSAHQDSLLPCGQELNIQEMLW